MISSLIKVIGDFSYKHSGIVGISFILCSYWQFFKGYDLWPFVLILSTMVGLAMWPFDEEQKKWKKKSKLRSIYVSVSIPLVLIFQALLPYIS
ncbi:hypothetical protein [Acetobacter thailandicus]|uniref:Uncharacterized protein n=1 Tax=Acetobacter thailandicus TaxID=1502842 RepID=A0ABT3QGG7_9PROT|nr:hypothetical protein [Acetobacter thailandicus]MCX2564379.1 hypothetical protein [Acetobacter thailandicus]NHN95361.1 hypothetical protein [Acetobacter thailandicus]